MVIATYNLYNIIGWSKFVRKKLYLNAEKVNGGHLKAIVVNLKS